MTTATEHKPFLADILATGTTTTDKGERVKVHSSISPEEGEFLQRLVREVKPARSLEVGLAYGVSALYICEALPEKSEHVAIDPYQQEHWGNAGALALERSERHAWCMREKSYLALPALLHDKYRFQFAFIDGWHTFDYTLVDFFFIDKMLDVGGIVVFDDAQMPAVNKVVEFIERNLSVSYLARGYGDGCAAFIKIAEDARSWDHFKRF